MKQESFIVVVVVGRSQRSISIRDKPRGVGVRRRFSSSSSYSVQEDDDLLVESNIEKGQAVGG